MIRQDHRAMLRTGQGELLGGAVCGGKGGEHLNESPKGNRGRGEAGPDACGGKQVILQGKAVYLAGEGLNAVALLPEL